MAKSIITSRKGRKEEEDTFVDDKVLLFRRTRKECYTSDWHQFTVEGNRFITNGHTVFCKWSYEALKSLVEEDDHKLNLNFTEWALECEDYGDYYTSETFKYYNPWKMEGYYDDENNITILDFGECRAHPLRVDEYKRLSEKVVEKALEIRNKFSL